ncbi:MAG: hypothetical protein Q8Q15_01960 [bacterium]|nr:hypothetical protein [bacterium]
MNVYAAGQPIGDKPFKGIGPLSDFAGIDALFLFGRVISVIIGVLTVAAGLWFIFQFLIGAFGWLTSGGDKAQLEGARKRLANSIIGLVIVVAAIFIIDLIGNLLGLDILNPAGTIHNIWD